MPHKDHRGIPGKRGKLLRGNIVNGSFGAFRNLPEVSGLGIAGDKFLCSHPGPFTLLSDDPYRIAFLKPGDDIALLVLTSSEEMLLCDRRGAYIAPFGLYLRSVGLASASEEPDGNILKKLKIIESHIHHALFTLGLRKDRYIIRCHGSRRIIIGSFPRNRAEGFLLHGI